MNASDDLAIITEALESSNFTDREKRVLEARYLENPPISFQVLATEFGLKSRNRPREILQQAISKIRSRFVFTKDVKNGLYDTKLPEIELPPEAL